MARDTAPDTPIHPLDLATPDADGQGHATRWYSLLTGLSIALACIVILAHAYLLPAGRWHADEYAISVQTARDGFPGLVGRIMSWSPRPIAELISYVYFRVSNTFERPLITPFLACLWLISLAGIALSAWIARDRRPAGLALLWFALALLVAKPGEMFFWPMATAAYLPCWAALAAATILQRGTNRLSQVALSIALLVAAFCSEVGAVTVLAYIGLLLAFRILRGKFFQGAAPLILPALGAVSVCLIVLTHRVQADHEIMDPSSGLAGHWAPSVIAAFPGFFSQIYSIAGIPALIALAVKLALLVSLPPVVRPNRAQSDDTWEGLIWVFALVFGAFVSIALAYHQFGTLCCERHDTLRADMVFLAIAAASCLFGAAFWLPRKIVLIIAIVVLMAFRAGPLVSDWHARSDIIAVRHANWRSGLGQGSTMTLQVGSPGQIIASDALPTGQFQSRSNVSPGSIPWYAWGIMTRFGKTNLTIAPAPQ
ncbi:hypothetical protein ACELLULO517_10545 [Acidisoma cellulosilytica]|uniref:Uncharacterized protein n=1 Tax=Acidisoma cellulosilyticum TaxID=2802395 RepID=A0A963Z2H9_9PROT|nr:hypothetical protein [Acidisoma cellulosilyticum]MCB8880670.1 hypothetical protein [Acidisoma cellulosilyticum]